tara:strand:+ start:408 stop:614 length:207 start_codon:yes stop_codon:yes gene_type:complete
MKPLYEELNIIAMYRVDIISVSGDNQKELTKVQAKINQWMTNGLLKKYEMQTTATHVIFNICRKKEAQ